jgi:hypothetical protein
MSADGWGWCVYQECGRIEAVPRTEKRIKQREEYHAHSGSARERLIFSTIGMILNMFIFSLSCFFIRSTLFESVYDVTSGAYVARGSKCTERPSNMRIHCTFDSESIGMVGEGVRWCLVELYEIGRFQGQKCRMKTRCEKSSKCVNKIDTDARNSRQYVAYLPLAMCVCLRCMRACVVLLCRHLPSIRIRLSFVYFCVLVAPFPIYSGTVNCSSCLTDDE